jgi:hypothetical protein
VFRLPGSGAVPQQSSHCSSRVVGVRPTRSRHR